MSWRKNPPQNSLGRTLHNKVMSPKKQMSPYAGSQSIKTSADDIIRRQFLEMAHCEWIIDPLRLLIEWVLCECRASSCASVISPCLLSESLQLLHYSLSVESLSLDDINMTVCYSAVQLKEKLVQMAKLQLSCTLLQSLLLDDYFHHCNWFQWIDWTCRSAKTVKVHIQGLPLAARFPTLLELALYPEIDNIPHAALEWIKTNSIMELEVVARVCKGALEIETSISGAYLCDKRKGGGWRGDMQQDGRQARKHHAYGCYSRTRWDKGSDNVKVANTCPLALQAPLDCDQSGLSAFLMNICMRLWQHQHVWYSMTSTPCCVNRPGSTWDKKNLIRKSSPCCDNACAWWTSW